MTRSPRSLLSFSAVLLACALSTARAEPPAAAEILFLHGKVLTLDAAGTVVQAVAVKDGRILATGSDAKIRRLAGAGTTVIDLQGRTVLPGFIDGHAHPSFAVRMIERYLDGRIATTPSVAVLLQKIATRAAQSPAGEWIIVAGSSSSQTRFAERRIPTRAELDSVASTSPVMFLNGSHEAVVNSRGLDMLGIKRGVQELKGAHIELDADGEPTGVIREGLAIFPDQRIPDDDLRRYYSSVIPQMWNARGYTSMFAIAPLNQLGVLKDLAKASPRRCATPSRFTPIRPADSCLRHSTVSRLRPLRIRRGIGSPASRCGSTATCPCEGAP